MRIGDYEVHPAAEIFPMMEKAQLDELTEDIRLNGLHHPITLFEGKILDGRNRAQACLTLGRRVAVSILNLVCSTPYEWVWSANARRRHLTPEQLTTALIDVTQQSGEWQRRQAEIEERIRKEQKAKSRAGKLKKPKAQSVPPIKRRKNGAHVAYEAVTELNASRTHVARGSSEIVRAVTEGDITLAQAVSELLPNSKGESSAGHELPVEISPELCLELEYYRADQGLQTLSEAAQRVLTVFLSRRR